MAGGQGQRAASPGYSAAAETPIEQNAKLVFDIADDIVILNSGRLVVDTGAAELTPSPVRPAPA